MKELSVIKTNVVGATIVPREGKKGTTYQARFLRDGFQTSKTFKTLDEAQAFIVAINTSLKNREPVNPASVGRLTLGQIFLDYISKNELGREEHNRVERLADELKDVPLEKFTEDNFEKYLLAKKDSYVPVPLHYKKKHKNFNSNRINIDGIEYYNKKYSSRHIRSIFFSIKKALKWHAKKYKYAFNETPFKEVKTPSAWEKPRTREVEPFEFDALLDATNGLYRNQEQTRIMLKFLYLSAFRIGETMLIKWKDFYDGAKGVEKNPLASYIHIPKENQKTGHHDGVNDRKAALRPELYKLITEELIKFKTSDDDLMFPFWKNAHYFYTRFKSLCAKKKIEGLTLHDFRHTAVSWFYTNTWLTDLEIMSITGHLDANTLRRYAKFRSSSIGHKISVGLNKT
ncbi:tyrosine-type recombinase/integrase [Delftia tsuruhatensis]|uniref:tyrosine-type recombinase/integrase n=1 Tax=Delftia tsuruhatensis TaxID=180282 RepID=UPI0008E2330B|nr:tyrosine-type recombinase/integrase [Delftia tsuruhatensis]SFB29258.1 Integrase [Delftia tsuruhatensis]